MKRIRRCVKTGLGLAVALAGCSGVTEVSTPDLIQVVERDGRAFDDRDLPAAVIDQIRAYKVIVVGEIHFLQEHRQLMAELIRRLHMHGYRQLLFEWPHMADWIVNDYVINGDRVPGWIPPTSLGGDLLAEIRAFNRTLPPASQFEVHGIDVNLSDYGGAAAFLDLFSLFTQDLQPHDIRERFLQRDYAVPDDQRDALESMRDELRARRTELIGAWGNENYESVVEQVDVELISVGVRALRADRYDTSVRLRENAMKQIAERRLTAYPYRTLINVGSNHAQKIRLKGTDQEWLGDYLVHKSPAASGSVTVISVYAAQINRSGSVAEDLLRNSPANEIFRVMHESWPQKTVFLPLDDPIFRDHEVPMISEGTVYTGKPKECYDILLLLPVAHQVPIN